MTDASFEVFPSIDLRGGSCVRLYQGAFDAETVYDDDPVRVAREFEAAGARWIHVVDLDVTAQGDLQVDLHHTVEDVGILLGSALKSSLGDKAGVRRFASALVPLDEALVQVALDLSGRPYLVYDVDPVSEWIGTFDPQLAEEFWRAFAFGAGIDRKSTRLNSSHRL